MYPAADTRGRWVHAQEEQIELTGPKKLRFVEQVVFVLAFISYFIPAGYAVSNTILLAWRAAATFFSFMAIILYITHHAITFRWLLICTGIFIYYVFSKLVLNTEGNTMLGVFNAIETCGFITLFEYGCKLNKREFIRLFLIAGIIMCAVHYETFLRYRHIAHGMRATDYSRSEEGIEQGTWFFFKHDNGSAFFFLPVMALLWYYLAEYGKGRVVTYVFTALSLYMYWSQWSVAAMLVFTAATASYIIICLLDGKTPLSYLGFRLAVVLGIAVCWILVEVSTGNIAVWLGEVFHKRPDLGGRGRIWGRTLEAISRSPVFGYGFEYDATTKMRIGANHCHNIVLQTLYTGGIVNGVVMLSGFLSYSDEKIFSFRSRSKGAAILNITTFLIFMLAGIDWYYFIAIPFAVLVACAYTADDQKVDEPDV